jgi:hypothetical protein
MPVVRVIHIYRAAWQSPLAQTVSPVAFFSPPRIIVCFGGSHRRSVCVYRFIQPRKADTCATTTFDRSLAYPAAVMPFVPVLHLVAAGACHLTQTMPI